MAQQNKIWFFIGICTFSFALGLLIGVSQLPVVGVFLSGILGLIVGIGGLIFKKRESNEQSISIDFRVLGKSLVFFSMFLITGIYLGSQYRANIFKNDPKEFIWSQENPPETIYEALDWIRIDEILTKKGFTKLQIQELYKLRLIELDSIRVRTLRRGYGFNNNYDYQYPFFKILIDSDENKKSENSWANDIALPEMSAE